MFTAKDKVHEISLCSITPCADLKIVGNIYETPKIWEAINGSDVRYMLDEQLTVDAVPTVHAHWIDYRNDLGEEINQNSCSNCKHKFYLRFGSPKNNNYRYCPNCGAKMDGGD